MLDQDNCTDTKNEKGMIQIIVYRFISMQPFLLKANKELLTFYLTSLERFPKFDTMFSPGE